MNFRPEKPNRQWTTYALALCVAVLFYVILTHLGVIFRYIGTFLGFFSVVFWGLVIAYILDPFVKFLQKTLCKNIKKEQANRSLSVFLALVVVLAFIVLLFVALIPQIVSSIVRVYENIDTYSGGLAALAETINESDFPFRVDLSKLASVGDNLIEMIKNFLQTHSETIVMTSVNIGSGVVNFIIEIILAIYMLADKVRLKQGARRLFHLLTDDRQYEELSNFWGRCHQILLRYIGFDLLDGLVVGCINGCFMALVGMDYGVLISVIVGVTNLAPTFGPVVGCVIGAFILVLVNPWHALIFIIFTICLQIFDGYIFKPRLFGDTLGVPAVWILIAIVVGAKMFGVLGILIAIPFAAIVDFIYQDYICVKLQERKDTRQKKSLSAEEPQTGEESSDLES